MSGTGAEAALARITPAGATQICRSYEMELQALTIRLSGQLAQIAPEISADEQIVAAKAASHGWKKLAQRFAWRLAAALYAFALLG
jgi:hypothetical protein